MSVEKVKQEIVDWHQFLHHFFRGEIEATEFTRMERVLTEDGVAKWILFHLTFIDPGRRPKVDDE